MHGKAEFIVLFKYTVIYIKNARTSKSSVVL